MAGVWLAPPTPWLLGLSAALLAGAAWALATGRERAAAAVLLASLSLLGALRAHTHPPPEGHIAAIAAGPTRVPTAIVEGRLVEEPTRWAADRTRLVLDLAALVQGEERRAATGRIQLTVYGETVPLGEGQLIAAEARLGRPRGFGNPGGFDYPAHLRREGILVVGSARGDRLVPLTPDLPPWPVRVRRWAVTTIRAELPEISAALLAGLLLGERTAIPREVDEAFRRAGVYHILAVSGFNVALLASSVFFALTLLGVPRRITAVVAGLVLIAFALIAGGEPSVLRATVMGLLLLAGALLERETQLGNTLALAWLGLLLWRPGDLWEPGFQLSFVATAGIIYVAPPATALLRHRGWPGWLAASVAVSAGAQLAVTPVMLAHFNQLSVLGVVANLLVVPLAAATTTLGMLALLVSLVSQAAGSAVLHSVWLLLLLLRGVVSATASLPGAMVHLPAPGWPAVTAWYGAVALGPGLGRLPRAGGAMVALIALAGVISAWPWVRPTAGTLRVTFLDVGQGEATLIELPEGPRMLVDGGPGGARRFDVGERVLAPFLWNRAVGRLDVVALSHSDPDHSGGLAAIMRHFRVGEFWETGRWAAGSEETLRAVERSGAPRRRLEAGQRLWLGPALVTVLHPDADPLPGENDNSLALRLDWRGCSILLTGDLGLAGESRLLERRAPLRALVLKVAHHGSRFSTGSAFLDAARPALAVISVGARNPFRHPSPESLARLAAAGARVYRTDRDGAVILETDGRTLRVTRWAAGATDRFELDPEQPP